MRFRRREVYRCGCRCFLVGDQADGPEGDIHMEATGIEACREHRAEYDRLPSWEFRRMLRGVGER